MKCQKSFQFKSKWILTLFTVTCMKQIMYERSKQELLVNTLLQFDQIILISHNQEVQNQRNRLWRQHRISTMSLELVLAGRVNQPPRFILLCLGFLICKMEVIIFPNKRALIIEISHLICVKHLEQSQLMEALNKSLLLSGP